MRPRATAVFLPRYSLNQIWDKYDNRSYTHHSALGSYFPHHHPTVHIAKTEYRRFETKIPGKRNCAASVPISTFMCLWAIYILYSHNRSAYSAAGKYVDRVWEYINRSPIHECWNWNWGRTIPFLGIYKRDFHCSARSYKITPLLSTLTLSVGVRKKQINKCRVRKEHLLSLLWTERW